MKDATLLTRRGDLQAATAAIQAALASHNSPGGSAGDDVVDVEARVVPDTDGRQPVDLSLPGVHAANDAKVVETDGESFISGRFANGVAARDYKLYIPPAAGATRLPLVVMLHGCTQDPDDFAAGTCMNDAAREQGMFVLYPAQSAKANPKRCWNWFKHNHQARSRGEPALLAGMVRDIMARYPIDPARVYVAGLSAGGAMAAILGETYPEIFAAVGVHSGLPAGAAQDLPSALEAMKSGEAQPRDAGHRIPTIVIHGDADHIVHPGNGECIYATHAGADGTCDTETGRAPAGHAWTRRVQRDGAGKVIAEHWRIHGAGHAWSGGCGRGSYTDPKGPDATSAMLRFFAQHRR